MSQSRKMSLAESCANIALGYGIAIGSQELIFPLYGIHLPLGDQLGMGGFFTVVSLVRSYALRRLFNGGGATMRRLIKRAIFVPAVTIGAVVIAFYHAGRNLGSAATFWWLDMRQEIDSVKEVWGKL